MRTLTLDIGNTTVKYGCFEDDVLRETAIAQTKEQVGEVVQRWKPTHVILASVAGPTDTWAADLCAQVPGRIVEFKPASTPLPIRNGYATPQTLGADRLAAAVGAAWLRPGRDTLIIDAGTAIKCDWVEGGHTFRGGSIAPGLRLRFQALHTFTGRLPLLEMPPNLLTDIPLTGDDTESAIRSGVLNGAVAEVNGLLDQYRAQRPALGVLLAGGDAAFFQSRLKGPIFVIPELVLLGLHRILVHTIDYVEE
ncbi:type III pantothenate kinase [Hymenobacter qilianensis]|uniref:Type III pantothenate kinase n=1 Tax=Hymenobacter qilianensis TaxID=1385715 RepID=A0ACB5PP19_9BACT|nr:type III pantothenate kinase [Hymenobacter qilianensis]GGF57093.1 type III pantothenate kinase [Hymenobacter qilianensis]